MTSLSARRIWLVARRDFFGYIKTWGFWLSFFLPVIFGALGFFMASGGVDFSPPRYETVLDETGEGIGEAMLEDHFERLDLVRQDVTERLPEGMREEARDSVNAQVDRATGDLVFIASPADTIEGLQPYLRGERMAVHNGEEVRLSGALRIFEDDGRARARYWSETVNANEVPRIARRYFRERARAAYLEEAGLTLDGYTAAVENTTTVDTFDPSKAATGADDSQAVTDADRIPYWAAAIAAIFLWFTVFSGAYMLLTSMLEEKLGKLMEMTLATTQFAEIMMGKLLGVALLTLTAMAPYIIMIVVGLVALLTFADPETVQGVREAISLKMIVFFPVFLILGYIFYGSLFIALGSLSESMQDAQTLTLPIMIILTACVLIVPQGLEDPNAPLVVAASWFPLSAPFAAMVRLPADPGWLTLLAITLVLLASTAGVAWLASKVFRHGVLSGGGVKGFGAWFKRAVLRRSAPRQPAG